MNQVESLELITGVTSAKKSFTLVHIKLNNNQVSVIAIHCRSVVVLDTQQRTLVVAQYSVQAVFTASISRTAAITSGPKSLIS